MVHRKVEIAEQVTHAIVERFSVMHGPIACQYKPTWNTTKMFLFDLQMIAFLI